MPQWLILPVFRVLDWLVITADKAGVGRGVRGYALAWFLQTYFGRRAVKKLTPQQVGANPSEARGSAARSAPQADTLLLGLPTPLSADDIRRLVDRVRPRRFAVFDYFDRHELAWMPAQEVAVRERTDRYLKPWFEPAWNYNLRMGMLPLRTHRQLFVAIAWDRLRRRLGGRRRPQFDVGFLGRPNPTAVVDDGGAIRMLDQRVDWLRELKSQASDLTFAGGLTEWDSATYRERIAAEPDLRALCYEHNSVPFPAYWRLIANCRVLLSPGGNAPWTYRHYESLYAGAAVVSIDFRERDMLVPLPREGMIHAPDGEAVVRSIRGALELAESRPTVAEENFAHLEQYLHYGSYARSRRATIDRFTAQFD